MEVRGSHARRRSTASHAPTTVRETAARDRQSASSTDRTDTGSAGGVSPPTTEPPSGAIRRTQAVCCGESCSVGDRSPSSSVCPVEIAARAGVRVTASLTNNVIGPSACAGIVIGMEIVRDAPRKSQAEPAACASRPGAAAWCRARALDGRRSAFGGAQLPNRAASAQPDGTRCPWTRPMGAATAPAVPVSAPSREHIVNRNLPRCRTSVPLAPTENAGLAFVRHSALSTATSCRAVSTVDRA